MLYKYVPIDYKKYAFDIISHGLIRFTQPGNFNDPFELQPSFDLLSRTDIAALNAESNDLARGALLSNMISNIMPGLERITRDSQGTQGGMFSIDNNKLARETFDSQLGILSLTEAPASLLMWAHYANNHNGLVLQFNERHSFFAPTCFENQIFELTQVQYTVDRPVVSSSSLYSDRVFYRKSPEWSYEQEWRLIKPLASANKTVENNSNNLWPIHLFRFPPDTLTGIIIGLRVKEADRDNISEICARPEFNHVQIYSTHLSRDHYKLEIHPALDGAPPSGTVFAAR